MKIKIKLFMFVNFASEVLQILYLQCFLLSMNLCNFNTSEHIGTNYGKY